MGRHEVFSFSNLLWFPVVSFPINRLIRSFVEGGERGAALYAVQVASQPVPHRQQQQQCGGLPAPNEIESQPRATKEIVGNEGK